MNPMHFWHARYSSREWYEVPVMELDQLRYFLRVAERGVDNLPAGVGEISFNNRQEWVRISELIGISE